MKKYQTILFDIDDTLLDFQENERVSLENTFKELNINFNENIREKYIKINKKLWDKHERDIIDRQTIFTTRFSQLFKEIHIEADGLEVEKIYRQNLNSGIQLIDNAIETCKNLYKKYDLYIITNGFGKTQHIRLEKSGLNEFFKDVFISEEIGFQKPNIKFFEYVFKQIPNFKKENTLIVGDSLTTDIKGGINAKLDTCWFNRNFKQNETSLVPTYEINKLEQIYKIL